MCNMCVETFMKYFFTDYASSTNSSGGPSSPTSASNPNDIMSRLRQLIAQNSESTSAGEGTSSQQQRNQRNPSQGERESSEPPSPMVPK